MKEKHSTVATFSDMDKAQEVKDRLIKEGIAAEVNDESNLQKFWFLSKPLAADKVIVDEKDFERARVALEAADAQDHVLDGEIRCPKCGSADVQYPQFTRKFLTTQLVEVFCFLHLIDKTFFCQKCQYTWPIDVALRHKTDILNWPDKHGDLVKKEKG
jgi:DNA-directed RNA polymerase subunit M/transcription elongation factor TFIIS